MIFSTLKKLLLITLMQRLINNVLNIFPLKLLSFFLGYSVALR